MCETERRQGVELVMGIALLRLPHAKGLDLPAYQTDGAAGMDVIAAIETEWEIEPGERVLVPTGIAVAIPPGFELQVRPRSGLAIHHGIFLLNSPGTVDSDYRGEIKIIMANFSKEPFKLQRGARIAQFVISPVAKGTWKEVPVLPDTPRGQGGFGHTGG